MFPAVINGVGGIYWSTSSTGLRWTRPELMMSSPHLDSRVPIHPIGLVPQPGRPTSLLVLHNVKILSEDVSRCDCSTKLEPFVCQYDTSF